MTESWLPAEHGSDNRGLGQRVTRGLFWSIVDNWGRQLLGLLVFVVLANLLFAADIGVVALAAVFVSFAQIFVDQGLGDALVQRRLLSREHLDSAFWVSMGMGAVLTVTGVLVAIPIALLLGEPQLQPILQVLSLSFLLTALSSVQVGILRRELAFRSLALRTLLATGGGGIVGISLAFLEFGPWALVGQQLAMAAITVATLWRISPWRPGLRFSGQHFRELFSFSRNIVGSDVLTFLSRNSDSFLVGAVLGTAPLGLYAVGHRILDATGSLLVGISRRMAFPTFSRLQHDRQRMKRAYFRAARLSGVLVIPGYIALALVAQELIVVVFGDRWRDSGPVAAVLFLIGPVVAINSFNGALLSAVGHPEILFRFRLVTMITNVIGFAIAVPFGIVAVAAAYVLRGYLLLPLSLYWQHRYAAVPLREYLLQLRGIVLASGGMAAAVLALKVVLGGRDPLALSLVAQIGLAAVVFPLLLAIVDRPLLRDVLDVARQVLPGRPRSRRGRKKGRVIAGDDVEGVVRADDA